MVGLDFMGTVAATMVVPIFLYPGLGIVGTAALASGLNALVGWWACEEQGPRVLPLKCLTTFLIAWALVAFIWREDISLWLAAQAF
jgi:predicted membrane-bound spermidine synthase